MPRTNGSGTSRPKTISAWDSSARTLRSIFQSGTARPTLVGPLGPFFFFFLFFFWGGGGRGTNLLFYSVYVQGFPLEFYFRGHKSPLTLIQGDIAGDFRGQSYDS